MKSSFWPEAGVRARLVVAAALCVASRSSQACSAQSAYLTVDGDVQTKIALSEADFKALPRSSMTAKEESGKDQHFEGVDLALVLISAGIPLKTDLKGANVAKYLHAEGTDACAAVFSLREFDQQAFLIADTLEGAPFSAANGPLQMISPNESRHSRSVSTLRFSGLRPRRSSLEATNGGE
ncbi:hypothetical protein I6F35_37725 [Bradyrhizobium sp. BRP22]|uniref:molybdopterin-dependent oxidoreductase n=1 Tax=Bradyrhizobium sp. BRP22 TaxID=2793821 RepID=UPI001CD4545F|nr:molybdopterin-dependent oxidoreductase [Bradyrhizobium sp. BRP22]MCA1458827.1 hypothetical protein [Bradyrhizobium sp. BRP22]